MAESQEVYVYDEEALSALTNSLSPSRLQPYFGKSFGDRGLAFKTYLWNARLSKAFLFPLHVAEIVTRNSMDRALTRQFGTSWLDSHPFAFTRSTQDSLERTIVGRRISCHSDPCKSLMYMTPLTHILSLDEP